VRDQSFLELVGRVVIRVVGGNRRQRVDGDAVRIAEGPYGGIFIVTLIRSTP